MNVNIITQFHDARVVEFNLRQHLYSQTQLVGETIQTPLFMPVATRASLKALWQEDLLELEYPLILNNAYHLYLRPGMDVLKEFQGAKNFMQWPRGLLTDSGGFQAFSLSKLTKFRDDGIEFQSHLDGSSHFFSPQKVLDIQSIIASDIVMPLDDCAPHDATKERVAASLKRTHEWFKTSYEYFESKQYNQNQYLFPIIQGGLFDDMRLESCGYLSEYQSFGIAIGGLSVGEDKQDFHRILKTLKDHLPKERLRYLMGVGTIPDILYAVEHGIDMFDCVLPTRNARNGQLFTSEGKINIKNSSYIYDKKPLDVNCACKVCQTYSRAYIRHLYKSGEILVYSLCTYHNLYFMKSFMDNLRVSIKEKTFNKFKKHWNSIFTYDESF